MKLKNKDIPKIKDLTLTSEEWHKSENIYTRMMVYNKKEVVIIKPPTGGDDLTDSQFKTIMSRFDSLESKVDRNTQVIKSVDAKVDAVDAKVDAVDAKVDANTKAIKSVQIDLNNIVEKNNLKR